MIQKIGSDKGLSWIDQPTRTQVPDCSLPGALPVLPAPGRSERPPVLGWKLDLEAVIAFGGERSPRHADDEGRLQRGYLEHAIPLCMSRSCECN